MATTYHRGARSVAPGFEVHTHSYVRGGRYNCAGEWVTSVTHSHPGGDAPHQHEGLGPATYTIDKDQWFARTGLQGGGRKKFTRNPSGSQLPIVALEEWQRSFTIIVDPSAPERCAKDGVTGPGLAPAHRMILGFGMRVADVRGSVQ